MPPFSFGAGISSGTSQASSGQVHFDERKFLLDGQGKNHAEKATGIKDSNLKGSMTLSRRAFSGRESG